MSSEGGSRPVINVESSAIMSDRQKKLKTTLSPRTPQLEIGGTQGNVKLARPDLHSELVEKDAAVANRRAAFSQQGLSLTSKFRWRSVSQYNLGGLALIGGWLSSMAFPRANKPMMIAGSAFMGLYVASGALIDSGRHVQGSQLSLGTSVAFAGAAAVVGARAKRIAPAAIFAGLALANAGYQATALQQHRQQGEPEAKQPQSSGKAAAPAQTQTAASQPQPAAAKKD